jgi:hypothetical protein
MAVRSDVGRLARLTAGREGRDRVPFFVIILPGGGEMAARAAASLGPGARPHLLLNGVGAAEAAALEEALPEVPRLRLTVLPGAPLKHGTVLTLLLRALEEHFGVLDHDCLVLDDNLLRGLRLDREEFLAAPDHPHFFNVNPATGLRFPRTHFLYLNAPLLRRMMEEHRITAEKRVRPPRRLKSRLAAMGIGTHNYPRHYLSHFDTLLLLMSLAMSEGYRVRWIPAAADRIVHLGHLAVHEPAGARRRRQVPADGGS